MRAKAIDEDQKVRIIRGEKGTLFVVVFWAPFCPFCPPYVQEICKMAADLLETNVELFLCNTDQDGPQKEFAKEMNATMVLPITAFIQDGDILTQMVGTQPIIAIKQEIARLRN